MELTPLYGYLSPSDDDDLSPELMRQSLDSIRTPIRASSATDAAQKVKAAMLPALVIRTDTRSLWLYSQQFPNGEQVAGRPIVAGESTLIGSVPSGVAPYQRTISVTLTFPTGTAATGKSDWVPWPVFPNALLAISATMRWPGGTVLNDNPTSIWFTDEALDGCRFILTRPNGETVQSGRYVISFTVTGA